MKNALLIIFVLILWGCKKNSLQLINPNEPSFESLKTEEGLVRFAAGIYNQPSTNYWFMAMANHDIMGDSYYIPWGNFGWRWVNQVASIQLEDGTTLFPPQGGEQKIELKLRNDRSFGNDNAFFHEWRGMYFANNQANMLLDVIEKANLGVDGEVKKKTLRAFAYWWKGFAYSRIGSMYIAGVINDKSGETNNNFVSSSRMLEEAAVNFDKSAAELMGIAENNPDFTGVFKRIIPDFTQRGQGGIVTPAMWKRHMNTYKARNILIAKKQADITISEWNKILAYCQDGIRSTDKIFTIRSADDNDFVGTAWAPWRLLNGWFFISERLIQDFKPGDNRFTRNVATLSSPIVNQSGRGFQFGTRYGLKDISLGGEWASTIAGLAEIPFACSFEENELMLAEAKIFTERIDEAVGHINLVRNYQRAGLAALLPGLTRTEAIEELRRERRIGLFLKNIAFYDARRWGVIDPVTSGGGRANAIVLTTGATPRRATINYNYMRYWDVPLNELDFNAPSSGSVPVAAN
jgi:hypothetical protein